MNCEYYTDGQLEVLAQTYEGQLFRADPKDYTLIWQRLDSVRYEIKKRYFYGVKNN